MRFLVFLTLAVISLGVVYGPRLPLMHNKKFSGTDLAQSQPDFAWVRSGYPLIQITWCLITALVYLLMGILFKNSLGNRGVLFFVAWFAGIGILDGLFAVYTRIYPAPIRTGYFYAYENGLRLRSIGLIQLLCGVIVVGATIFLAFTMSLN